MSGTTKNLSFKWAVPTLILGLLCGCQHQPQRTAASEAQANRYSVDVGKGEGLTTIAGVECSKPIDKDWPKVTVHIPNNNKKGNKEIEPKSVEIEVLSNMNERLKNFTMLKGQKKGTLALKPIMDKGPLQVRVAQNFIWNHGKKKHQIQNIIYYGTVDRENFCLNLPEYKTVKATIKLSAKFVASLKDKSLDLSKGYIEAKNQLGELSVDMKVKYDPSRATAGSGLPRVWKTDLLMKKTGGEVVFTPSPWHIEKNEFSRLNGVSVKVSPNQSEITVNID